MKVGAWPVSMFRRLLPRLLDIIYEINARFIAEISQHWPGDTEKVRRMSLIQEGSEPMIRMAYLAIVGSFSINGVAELHSRLLREGLFRDFAELWPHRFNNKTNGVTQRRWLAACNPGLASLISETLGDGWKTNLDELDDDLARTGLRVELRREVRDPITDQDTRRVTAERHQTWAGQDAGLTVALERLERDIERVGRRRFR